MKIFIPCEESQEVTKAFRERGHEAYSCDILPCSGGHPEWHIQDDCLNHIDDGYDMMIAFPPCTHMAVSGAAWFYKKQKEQEEALAFVKALMAAPIPRICIENPVGVISTRIKRPTQIIQPWHFGDAFQKTTCLWLKGLPRLKHPSNELRASSKIERGEFITFASGKKMPKWYAELRGNGYKRSKTFPGIARAMAEQWGGLDGR